MRWARLFSLAFAVAVVQVVGEPAVAEGAPKSNGQAKPNGNGLGSFDSQLNSALSAADSPEEKLKNLQRLLKLKEVQLEDAQKVADYYNEAFKDTEGKVQGLRDVIKHSREGRTKLEDELREETEREEKLRQEVAKQKLQLQSLEVDLNGLRESAADPALAKWVERRIESMGALIDSPSAGRRLGEVVGFAVDEARSNIQSLEESVEGHVVSPGLAMFFSFVVLALPITVIVFAFSRFTKALSYRQHVLLCHIFNMCVLLTSLSLHLITGKDPLVAMHHSAPHYFLLLSCFFLVQWPVMVYLLCYSIVFSCNRFERQYYLAQLLLFVSMCYHVMRHTRERIMLLPANAPLSESNAGNLLLYVLSTCAMISLTVSAADSRREGLVSDVRSLITTGQWGDGPTDLKHSPGNNYTRNPSVFGPKSPSASQTLNGDYSAAKEV